MPSPWIPSGGGGVTAVTGTSPIASSGGTAPDISISALAFGFTPVNYQYWISQGAPAGGNGSIRRPFNAVADAIAVSDALPAGSIIDYFLGDQAYLEGSLVFSTGKSHRPISMVGGSSFDGVINLACSGAPSGLTLFDIIGGVGLTGSGDAAIMLVGSTLGVASLIGVDTTLMGGGNVTIDATNYTYSVNGANRIIRVQSENCNLGTMFCANAQYSHDGGNSIGDVTAYQWFNRGITNVAFSGSNNFNVTAVSPNALAGFVGCAFSNNGPTFTGPVGSFTTDIDSANNFVRAGGSLNGAATTQFTVAGYEGYSLQVIAGFPQWAPAGGGGASITSGYDAVDGNHNLDLGAGNTAAFLTKSTGGQAAPYVEVTFPSWANGDTLEADWSMVVDSAGGGGTLVNAYFLAWIVISTDGGATFEQLNPSGQSWNFNLTGVSAGTNGALSMSGSGDVVIPGTTPPIVRIAYFYGGAANYWITGSTTDTGTGAAAGGCRLRAKRIPSSLVVQPSNAVLQPFP